MLKAKADAQVVPVGPTVSSEVKLISYVQLAPIVALDRVNVLLVPLDITVLRDRQLRVSVWLEPLVIQVRVLVQIVHLAAFV